MGDTGRQRGTFNGAVVLSIAVQRRVHSMILCAVLVNDSLH